MIAEFIEVCIEEGTLLDEDGECLSRGRFGAWPDLCSSEFMP